LASVVCVILRNPSPDVAAIFHGCSIAGLLMILPLAGAVRPRVRAGLVIGVAAALGYILLTSVPVISAGIVPWLPTEALISARGDGLRGEFNSESAAGREEAHWTAQALGSWGLHKDPSTRGLEWMSPDQVAFHRIAHDVAAIVLGLTCALATMFLVEERPKRWDSEMLPANQGRGSPEALRRLIERGRGGSGAVD